MDEKKPLPKEERRQRRRRLEPAKKSRKDGAKPSAVHPDNAASSEAPAPPERSGRQKRPQITAADVQGLKYFDKRAPLLQRLHDEGCERDAANNRTLHYDQYCMLILLSLFNPIVTALRGIQQASELKKVQRKLGCRRCPAGTAVALFGTTDIHVRRRPGERLPHTKG